MYTERFLLGESPAKDFAQERAFTDRTSLCAFRVEEYLQAREDMLRRFLSLSPKAIKAVLCYMALRQSKSPRPIPLADASGICGFYGSAGCPLPDWDHAPATVYVEDNSYPRLLVTTSIIDEDFPFDLDLPSCNAGGHDRSLVRFTCRPLRLLAHLGADGQVSWDWSDIEALHERSFQARLIPLCYSIRRLLGSEESIIPAILSAVAGAH